MPSASAPSPEVPLPATLLAGCATAGVATDAVAAAELREPQLAALPAEPQTLRGWLSEDEWRAVGHYRAPRLREFTAGRLCARQALAQLGIPAPSLPPQPDRQPRWPDGVVGSITHTAGYCAAVVAQRRAVLALGVDAEPVDAVRRALWGTICTAEEIVELERLAPAQQPLAATLRFIAKEAFFKCQFPLTHEWLDFQAVRVQVTQPGGTRGSEPGTAQDSEDTVWRGRFRIEPQRPLAFTALPGAAAALEQGRYLREGRWVKALLVLPAAACGVAAAGERVEWSDLARTRSDSGP